MPEGREGGRRVGTGRGKYASWAPAIIDFIVSL